MHEFIGVSPLVLALAYVVVFRYQVFRFQQRRDKGWLLKLLSHRSFLVRNLPLIVLGGVTAAVVGLNWNINRRELLAGGVVATVVALLLFDWVRTRFLIRRHQSADRQRD